MCNTGYIDIMHIARTRIRGDGMGTNGEDTGNGEKEIYKVFQGIFQISK